MTKQERDAGSTSGIRNTSDATHVAIVRHTLGLRSEPFILQQASTLPCRATFVTRDEPIAPLPLPHVTFGRTASEKIRYTVGDPRPLERALAAIAPHVVHAHFGVEGAAALGASRRMDLPLVTTFHGFDATRTIRSLAFSRHPAWWKFAAERRVLLKRGDAFIAVSYYVAQTLIDLGVDAERLHVIPTGVDTAALEKSVLPETPSIIHVARLVEKKGTRYLIEAMVDVVKAVDGATLTIIGEGPLRPHLEELARDLGVSQSVTFAGSQPHQAVVEAIRLARCLALPSVTAKSGDAEGLGQVLLEAAALGRPVVATRHGGIVEVVEHHGSGVLVEERSAADLAHALEHVLADHGAARYYADRARELVVRDFDLSTQSKKLAAVLSQLSV